MVSRPVGEMTSFADGGDSQMSKLKTILGAAIAIALFTVYTAGDGESSTPIELTAATPD